MDAKDPAQATLQLLDVMKALRAPDGCPWDIQRTPESLAPYIIEEAAEVVDAIESGNPRAIKDETGDLLLQVVFIAQIFQERGLFDFGAVANTISEKLVRRHPHVFGDRDRSLSEPELDQQWEAIKNREQKTGAEKMTPLGHIPSSLPALQRAQKVLERARKNGLPLPGPATPRKRPAEHSTAEALGEGLFALVIQANEAGLDAEQILRQHIRKLLAELDSLYGTNSTAATDTESATGSISERKL